MGSPNLRSVSVETTLMAQEPIQIKFWKVRSNKDIHIRKGWIYCLCSLTHYSQSWKHEPSQHKMLVCLSVLWLFETNRPIRNEIRQRTLPQFDSLYRKRQLQPIRFFLEYISANQAFFSDFSDQWYCLLTFLQSIRFFDPLSLFFKRRSSAPKCLYVCLSMQLLRKQYTLNKWKLTNWGNRALCQLINHQKLCFVGWDFTIGGRKLQMGAEIIFCI